ncbi:MAG: T9SS type A sorting domain-containing protein [Chitinophagaceae bacterium]
MKNKILLTVTAIAFATLSYAGNMQATISQVNGQTNVFRITLKPLDFTNPVGAVSNAIFTLLLPTASFSVKPTVAITTNNLTGLGFLDPNQTSGVPTSSTQMIGGVSYYVWELFSSGISAPLNWQQNVEFNALEVTFSNTPSGNVATNLKLANIPDGGTTGNDQFYMNIALTGEVTNHNARFYGGTPVNVVASDPYSTFSYTQINVSLPTKFINFFATKKEDNADLTWTVDNEEKNAYFDVQRSNDGRLFTDVIRVQALRNGQSSNTYTTPDVNLSRLGSKILYYRIKQVEAGGDISYSEVRQINLDKKNFTIGLYPNPVVSSTKLVIDAPEAGKAFIVVRDAAGKTVQQINMEFVKGINQKDINASMLPAGDYNVTVVGEKFNQTVKMTKTN